MAVISEVNAVDVIGSIPVSAADAHTVVHVEASGGKHADEADNAKAKLIIGIILLVVLIGATMVLIITSTTADDIEAADASDAASLLPDDEASNTSLVTEDVSPSPSPTPSPSPVIEVAAVVIIYTGDGYDREDVTMSSIGEELQFGFRTIPETEEADQEDMEITWESSDEEVFMVLNGKVTAIGEGYAKLTCTVDGIEGTCIIRVVL